MLALIVGIWICGLVLAGVCAWFELKRKNPFALLWMVLIFMYFVPSITDVGRQNAQRHDHAIPVTIDSSLWFEAMLFAIAFSLIYLLTRLMTAEAWRTGPVWQRTFRYSIIGQSENGNDIVSIILTLAVFLAFLLAVTAILLPHGISGLLQAGYTYYRNEASTYVKLTSYYLIFACSGVALYLWCSRKYALLTIVVASVIGVFFVSQTRQLLLPMVFVFYWYFLSRFRPFNSLVIGMAGIFIGYAAFLVLQLLRYEGSYFASLGEIMESSFWLSYFQYLSQFEGEPKLRYAYYFFVKNNDTLDSVGYGITYVRSFLVWLPTDFSADVKPQELTKDLYQIYYDDINVRHPSLNITFIGEVFANFRWAGVIMGSFWAFFAFMSDRVLRRLEGPVLASVVGFWGYFAILAGRGAVYNSMAVVFYSSVFIAVVVMVSRFLRYRSKGHTP